MTTARAPRLVGREPLPTALAGGWPQGGEPETWLLSVSSFIAALDAAAPGKILDAEELERAGRFLRAEDRERYTAAHIGLRQLLGGYLGMEPSGVPFTRENCPGCGGPHGRPAVAGGGGPHFSLSHSAGLVLLAFAATPVGVDVEEIPAPGVVAELREAILHPGERAELDALPPADRAAAFGRCWARKEAYLKGTGAGLADNPDRTRVGVGPVPYPVPGWTVTDLAVPAGYSAALATATTC